MDAAAAAPTILPSLGTSGAIYSTVVSTLAFPDGEVSLVLPPTLYSDSVWGWWNGVTFIGILRGWRYGHPPSVFMMDCTDDSAR